VRLARLKDWARIIKRDVIALWLAAGDQRVSWLAKAVAATVAAYALSPIDLIPDFIPVIGYLDDLLIVPLGIMIAVRLVPPPVMAELRERASRQDRKVSKAGAIMVVTVWIGLAALAAWLLTA
jgi:uncharacterized membrane protein YkvA (DUF1232 family)